MRASEVVRFDCTALTLTLSRKRERGHAHETRFALHGVIYVRSRGSAAYCREIRSSKPMRQPLRITTLVAAIAVALIGAGLAAVPARLR